MDFCPSGRGLSLRQGEASKTLLWTVRHTGVTGSAVRRRGSSVGPRVLPHVGGEETWHRGQPRMALLTPNAGE